MEKYSLYELRNNLVNKVANLGISQKFKENPAFQDVIDSIDSVIATMNVENPSNLEINSDNKNINFEYSYLGKKYDLIINNINDNEIRCLKTLSQKQDRETLDGYYQVDEKHINEIIAKVDENGNLTLYRNYSLIDNDKCSDKEVNNFTTSEIKKYNPNGIMMEREFKSFGENKLQENINDVRIDSALYIPRLAFEVNNFSDKYIERTLLRREMLDTARLIYKDNLNEIEYQTTVKLNEYNGLKNMSIQGYQDYPDDIVISPISKFEIEQKIVREDNPKVQEGLRELSIGREEYNYNSKEDQHFIRKGVEETSIVIDSKHL